MKYKLEPKQTNMTHTSLDKNMHVIYELLKFPLFLLDIKRR